MYEIYAYPSGSTTNKLLIYQPGNNKALVLAPKLTREVSRGGSLSFTMPRDHPCYDMLPKMRTVVSVHRDGKEIWRGRVLNHEADWYNRRAVYCEGALSYFNDSCITPFNFEGKLSAFLQHLLDAHNSMVGDTMKQFELGTVTAALGDLVVHYGDADEYGVGEDYGSTWAILDKLVLQTFGGYCYCTYNASTGKNVLNYCDQAYEAKRQTAQDIEYGVNLLDLTEKTDTNDLMTRIYPVGNKHTVTETKWKWKILWWGKKEETSHEERYGIMDTTSATVAKYLPSGYSYDLGDGWIQNDASVAKFGVVSKIVEFDTDSDNDTFAAGVQHLQQNSLMVTSYTIKAVDLVDAGYDTERLDFAMYSHIVSAPHSVDAIMLCTKLVEPLDRPDKKEFTFGMTRRALTDRIVANMGKTNLLEENAASSEKYHQNTLDQLLGYQKKNDAAVGDKVDKGEVIASINMTKESVTIEASKINLKGAVTSDSISVDGLDASVIKAGTITAEQIKAGSIVADNLSPGITMTLIWENEEFVYTGHDRQEWPPYGEFNGDILIFPELEKYTAFYIYYKVYADDSQDSSKVHCVWNGFIMPIVEEYVSLPSQITFQASEPLIGAYSASSSSESFKNSVTGTARRNFAAGYADAEHNGTDWDYGWIQFSNCWIFDSSGGGKKDNHAIIPCMIFGIK